MLDSLDPRLFWSGFVLVWFLASLVAGTLLGRIIHTFNR
jgi:hypothetical protein